MTRRQKLVTLGILAGLGLFIAQIWRGFEGVRQYPMLFVRPIYLLEALLFTSLSYFLQMCSWVLIMRYLGVPITLGQTLHGYLLSFVARYVPGSVWGYWTRGEWLARSHNVGYNTSTMGSLLEIIAFIVTAISISMLYISTRLTGPGHFLTLLASISLIVGAATLMPRYAVRLGRTMLQRFSRSGHVDPMTDPLAENKPSYTWLVVTILYLSLWGLYGGCVLSIYNAILPSGSNDILGATFAFSLSWLVGFLVVFVPTGLGIREWSLSYLLLSTFHTPGWEASVIALAARFATILAELLWLGLGLAMNARKWWAGHRTATVTSNSDE